MTPEAIAYVSYGEEAGGNNNDDDKGEVVDDESDGLAVSGVDTARCTRRTSFAFALDLCFNVLGGIFRRKLTDRW